MDAGASKARELHTRQRVPVVGIALLLTLCAHAPATRSADFETLMLVTEQEAALPNVTSVAASPDLSEGPLIEISSPDPGSTYRDGFPVDITFLVGPSGYGVNPESLKVVYKKMWGIDITSRLREFIGANFIRVPKADFPVGVHTVQIYIEDLEKNASTRRVTVTVAE